jgi:hypothetical protein
MANSIDKLAEEVVGLKRMIRDAASKPQLGTSSIENGGALQDRGPDGTTYQFIGRQFDGTNTVTQMNGPVPPAPTFPGASPMFGGMNVSWDGMFEDGAFGPMDLARVDVHILDEDHTDPLLYAPAGTLLAGAGGSVSVLLDAGEYWAVLVAWTTSGKYAISGASNMVNVVEPTVELPDPTDGLAPTEAPVVTGHAFGVGGVEFQWPEITSNEDPIHYNYWASLTTPVDTSGSPSGFVVQPNVRISRINDVQVPMDGVGQVYIKVAAADADGQGPMSNEAAALPRAPEVDAFLAAFIGALEIEASQIRGQFISADLALLSALQVGSRLEIDGNDSTITIFAAELDEAGERIPLIQLDPEGSTFRGRVIADDVSVLHGLILQGDLSQIAENAGVTIMAGVGNPTIGPGLSAQLKTATWPAVPSGYRERGAFWDATDDRYLRLLVPNPTYDDVSNQCKVERITEAGVVTSSVTLGNIISEGEEDMNGIVRLGSSYYTMYRGTSGGYTFWDMAKFSASTGAFQTATPRTGDPAVHVSPAWGTVSEPSGLRYFYNLHRPAIGITKRINLTDGSPTEMLVTAIWADSSELVPGVLWDGPGVYAQRRYPADLSFQQFNSGGDVPLDNNSSSGKDLSFVKGFSDPTNDNDSRLWIGVGTQIRQYNYSTSVGAYVKSTSWSAIVLPSAGFGLDKTPLASTFELNSVHNGGSIRNVYSKHTPVTNQKLWVTFTNLNTVEGTHTLDSPPSSIAIPAGRFVQITLPPSGTPEVDSAAIYAGLSTTGVPADSSLKRRLETLTAERTMLVDPGVAGGSETPPSSSTFTGGVPGWLKTESGGFELHGDGSGDWPVLREQIESGIPLIQRGSQSITPSAADTWTAGTPVVFDTPFATAPTVIPGIASGAAGTATMQARVDNVSTTGFTPWYRSSSTGARTVTWIAVGVSP